MKHPIVVIESPFRGTVEHTEKENLDFARWLCRDMALRGFNPVASHVYYTNFLTDGAINERMLGIHLGLQMALALDPVLVTFNLRPGEEMSSGMSIANDFWDEYNFPRQLIKWEQKTIVPVRGTSHESITYIPVAIEMLDV